MSRSGPKVLVSKFSSRQRSTLGKRLRAACGAGGTVKDGVLEVQGDHCERVMALLKAEGFVVKRAGG